MLQITAPHGSNYQPAPTRVRGSATGTRANRSVAKRTREQFGNDDCNGPVEHPSKRSVHMMPDRRRDDELEEQKALANTFLVLKGRKEQARLLTALSTSTTDPAVHDSEHAAIDGGQSQHASGLQRPDSARAAKPFSASGNLTVPISSIQRQLYRMEESLNEVRYHYVQEKFIMPALRGGGLSSSVAAVFASRAVQAAPTVSESTLHPDVVVREAAAWLQPGPRIYGTGSTTRFLTPTEVRTVHSAVPSDDAAVVVDPTAVQNATEHHPITINTPSSTNDAGPVFKHDDEHARRVVQIEELEFTYTRADVPDFPLGLNYSGKNLALLFVHWFDAEASPIKIKGQGIPLRYLPSVYSRRAGNRVNTWERHRSTWNNWKFIMDEFEALGSDEAAFWMKYTGSNGQHMSYSKVLTSLKVARKRNVANEDAPAARDALQFFGGDLSAGADEPRPGRFEFRRGARYHVVTSDREIAKRWRQLLEEDEDVRRRWEAMKAGRTSEDSDPAAPVDHRAVERP